MKWAGIIFLIVGAFCVAILAFGWLGVVPRGDELPWTFTGPVIFGSFSLGAGISLIIATRASKKKPSVNT